MAVALHSLWVWVEHGVVPHDVSASRYKICHCMRLVKVFTVLFREQANPRISPPGKRVRTGFLCTTPLLPEQNVPKASKERSDEPLGGLTAWCANRQMGPGQTYAARRATSARHHLELRPVMTSGATTISKGSTGLCGSRKALTWCRCFYGIHFQVRNQFWQQWRGALERSICYLAVSVVRKQAWSRSRKMFRHGSSVRGLEDADLRTAV